MLPKCVYGRTCQTPRNGNTVTLGITVESVGALCLRQILLSKEWDTLHFTFLTLATTYKYLRTVRTVGQRQWRYLISKLDWAVEWMVRKKDCPMSCRAHAILHISERLIGQLSYLDSFGCRPPDDYRLLPPWAYQYRLCGRS